MKIGGGTSGQEELTNFQKEKEQLLDRMRSQRVRLSAFEKAAELVKFTEDVPRLLDTAIEDAVELIGARAGAILLIDIADQTTLTFSSVKGPQVAKLKGQRLQMGESIAGWVAQQGVAQIVPDPDKDPRFKREISQAIEFLVTSILCVPIRSQGRVVGALELLNKEDEKQFTPTDVEVANIFSSQIGQFLVLGSRLKTADRSVYELSMLTEAGIIINSTLELREVLTRVMRMAERVTGAQASSLMLLDEKTNELYFEVALGEKGEEVKQFRVKLGEGIAGWVAEHGEPLLVADVEKDPRFARQIAEKIHFPTKSILCVPLKVKDRILGIVEVLNKIDAPSFDENDQRLLSSLAGNAAVAIDNARLYEDQRKLFMQTVGALSAAIDAKDPYTRGHSARVALFSLVIFEELPEELAAKMAETELADYEEEELELSGLLHDVGKIGVPDRVLGKPGRLTKEEYEEIKQHPVKGDRIIREVEQLQRLLPIILHHHERIDGMGYPDGLKGGEIPLLARLVGVADAFDALTSERPYRAALSGERACEILRGNANSQFDPEVVEAAVRAYEKGRLGVVKLTSDSD